MFAPQLDPSYAVWCGPLRTPEEQRALYQVDACLHYLRAEPDPAAATPPPASPTAIDAWLLAKQQQAPPGPPFLILTLHGVNSDGHKPTLEATPALVPALLSPHWHRSPLLWTVMSDLRARKSPAEIAVMRYVCRVSSEAHNAILRRARPGMAEYHLESLFRHYVYAVGGCRHVGYTCICCSGPNAAILHYGHAGAPNDRTFKAGDIMMLDMGGEYGCYTADISCSWPADGVFTPLQKAVYDAVADAQRSVIAAMRPGVAWTDMHLLAEQRLLAHLQGPALGVVRAGADLAQAQAARLAAVFMPHGLGHLLGLDVHDAGGYLPHTPPRSQAVGLRSLRTARVLEAGMILTVEPGLYFIDCLLDGALADPALAGFLDAERLQALRGFGGVRLEDDVLVTETGAENLTVCPRTTEAVEAMMAEGRALYPQPFKDIESFLF